MKGRHLLICAAAGLGLPVLAHHSDAIYDRETTVAGEGIVTQFTYRNPHVLIGVELENDDGEVVEWLVETGSTPIMNRSGWSAGMLSPGDRINVRLHPERTGRLHGILNSLETPSGEVFMQIEEEAEETVSAESLAGVWRGARQPSMFQQARNMVLTPAAEAERADYAENGPDPSRECDPRDRAVQHRQRSLSFRDRVARRPRDPAQRVPRCLS